MKAHYRQRGFTLIEALVSLLILSFGILGLTHFQVSTIAQVTESNSRAVATAMSEELLSQVRSDLPNATCYTWPASGTCGNAFGTSQTKTWAGKVASTVNGFSTVTSTLAGNQLTVTITWVGKATKDKHTLVSTTDVRQ